MTAPSPANVALSRQVGHRYVVKDRAGAERSFGSRVAAMRYANSRPGSTISRVAA